MENDFLKKTPGRRVLFSAALLASLCMGSPQFSYAAAENVQTVMQNGTVKGRIVDGTGEPVIGASVQVKGSGTGVISDIDGNFTLSNVSSDAVLVISYVGYQTQEIKVAGKPFLCVEPICGTPNGLNTGDCRMLYPGETWEGEIKFTPERTGGKNT